MKLIKKETFVLSAIIFMLFFWASLSRAQNYPSSDNNPANQPSNVPMIGKITDIKNNAVVLPIKSDDFKNRSAAVLVIIENQGKNMFSYQESDVQFNKDGVANLNVSDLDPGTRYFFSIAIRDHDSNIFSVESDGEEATTSNQ